MRDLNLLLDRIASSAAKAGALAVTAFGLLLSGCNDGPSIESIVCQHTEENDTVTDIQAGVRRVKNFKFLARVLDRDGNPVRSARTRAQLRSRDGFEDSSQNKNISVFDVELSTDQNGYISYTEAAPQRQILRGEFSGMVADSSSGGGIGVFLGIFGGWAGSESTTVTQSGFSIWIQQEHLFFQVPGFSGDLSEAVHYDLTVRVLANGAWTPTQTSLLNESIWNVLPGSRNPIRVNYYDLRIYSRVQTSSQGLVQFANSLDSNLESDPATLAEWQEKIRTRLVCNNDYELNMETEHRLP